MGEPKNEVEPLRVGAMLWSPIARGTWAMNVGDGVLLRQTEPSKSGRATSIEYVPGLRVVSREFGIHERAQSVDEMVATLRGEDGSAVQVPVIGYALLPAGLIADGWTLVKSIAADVDDAVFGYYGES